MFISDSIDLESAIRSAIVFRRLWNLLDTTWLSHDFRELLQAEMFALDPMIRPPHGPAKVPHLLPFLVVDLSRIRRIA